MLKFITTSTLCLLAILFTPGCSKQQTETVHSVDEMATDNDVALYYRATQLFTADIIAAKDTNAVKAVIVPKEFLELARKVSIKYQLFKLSDAERLTVIKNAFEAQETKPNPDIVLMVRSCEADRIKKVSRCDRDMAMTTGALYTGAMITTAVSLGTGAVAAWAGAGGAMIWAFWRHSNCVDDATEDYQDCKENS